MTKGLPRWFRAMFVITLLALCCVIATQLVHQHTAHAQIAHLQDQIEILQKRIVKQQSEYDEYITELPTVEAELTRVAPQADEIVREADRLKAERKALRAATKEQDAIIKRLQEQAMAENTAFLADTQNITGPVQEAIQSLTELRPALKD